MRRNFKIILSELALVLVLFAALSGCSKKSISYVETDYQVERGGIRLFVQKIELEGSSASGSHGKDILLVHGLTFSSWQFDLDVDDYSLARYLARKGYRAWIFDIAGFGRSQKVKDGFAVDSEWSAADAEAVAQFILKESGTDRIDVLGWSMGGVTAALFAESRPDMVRRMILYAPILTAFGKVEVTEPYIHFGWKGAVGDFQQTQAGDIDYSIVEKNVVNAYASQCWRYDGPGSPTGRRCEIFSGEGNRLFDAEGISVPTMIIYGDMDNYMNMDVLDSVKNGLIKKILVPGASHMMMVEKPYYRKFQKEIASFLK